MVLQQGTDIARQSAVPPNRCVSGVSDRLSYLANCPQLSSRYPFWTETNPQKITIGEMRTFGVRDVLI
jgi:hypothetical protein